MNAYERRRPPASPARRSSGRGRAWLLLRDKPVDGSRHGRHGRFRSLQRHRRGQRTCRLLPFPWAPPRVGKRLVGKGGKRRWELPRGTRVSQRAHFGGTAGHLFGGKGAASAQLLASRTAAFREAQDGLDKSVLCGSNKWRTKQDVSRQRKHRCMRPDTSLRDGHQYALIMSHAYESNITNILSNSTHQSKRTHNILIWPRQAGGREGCPPFLIFSDFFFSTHPDRNGSGSAVAARGYLRDCIVAGRGPAPAGRRGRDGDSGGQPCAPAATPRRCQGAGAADVRRRALPPAGPREPTQPAWPRARPLRCVRGACESGGRLSLPPPPPRLADALGAGGRSGARRRRLRWRAIFRAVSAWPVAAAPASISRATLPPARAADARHAWPPVPPAAGAHCPFADRPVVCMA